MAHLGYRNLKKLINTATGVEFKGLPPEETCEDCMTEHQHCHMFRVPSEASKKFLKHVHSDIAEPYLTTHQGHKYM